MKHLSVLIAGTIVIIACGLVTGQEYQAYKNREHARVNSASIELANQRKQAQQDLQEVQNRASQLYDQCKIGLSDYNLLPAPTKALKTTAAPDCGLPIVQ